MEIIILGWVLFMVFSDIDDTVSNSHLDEWMYSEEEMYGKSSPIKRR